MLGPLEVDLFGTIGLSSPTCMHACMHTYIQTYIHTCINIYMPTHIHTYVHTCIHAHMHTYIHTYTYTHAHIHTYTHTHIAARAQCERSGRGSQGGFVAQTGAERLPMEGILGPGHG